MKVRVQLFSRLKDIVGASELEIYLDDGMTAGTLLDELYARHPKLRAWDGSLLIGAGVDFVDRNYILKPRDEISIMPPVQGG